MPRLKKRVLILEKFNVQELIEGDDHNVGILVAIGTQYKRNDKVPLASIAT
jgi:hypothetical protein